MASVITNSNIMVSLPHLYDMFYIIYNVLTTIWNQPGFRDVLCSPRALITIIRHTLAYRIDEWRRISMKIIYFYVHEQTIMTKPDIITDEHLHTLRTCTLFGFWCWHNAYAIDTPKSDAFLNFYMCQCPPIHLWHYMLVISTYVYVNKWLHRTTLFMFLVELSILKQSALLFSQVCDGSYRLQCLLKGIIQWIHPGIIIIEHLLDTWEDQRPQ